MDILDDMGVSKLSAKVFFKKWTNPLTNVSMKQTKQSLQINKITHLLITCNMIDYTFNL